MSRYNQFGFQIFPVRKPPRLLLISLVLEQLVASRVTQGSDLGFETLLSGCDKRLTAAGFLWIIRFPPLSLSSTLSLSAWERGWVRKNDTKANLMRTIHGVWSCIFVFICLCLCIQSAFGSLKRALYKKLYISISTNSKVPLERKKFNDLKIVQINSLSRS